MNSSYYIQLLVSVGILSGILWLALRFSKRVNLKRFSNEMKIVDRLLLAPTASLLVVKVRDQEMLVSQTNQEIRLLKVFEAKSDEK